MKAPLTHDPAAAALFNDDCERAIFRATVGGMMDVNGEPFSVNVYPRKTAQGYVWIVWDCINRDPDGHHRQHAGAVCKSLKRDEAITEAVGHLLRYWQ